MNTSFPYLSRNRITTIALVILSGLLAIYGPVSVTNAQAAVDTQKFKETKAKALTEIERRLDNYKKNRKGLGVDAKIINTYSIATDNGEVAAPYEGLAEGKLKFPNKIKEKIKKISDIVIEKLESLEDRVKNTTSLEDLDPLVESVDEQYQLTQLTDIQSAVTNSIESLSGVIDRIQTTVNNMRGQVTKMQECISGIKSDIEANADVAVDSLAPGCDNFNLSSNEVIVSAESQLANIEAMTSTMKSAVSSSIYLMTSLASTFSGLLSKDGSLGSLDKLGTLLEGDGDINTLLGSENSKAGRFMISFRAITSQLGIANNTAGNTRGLLGNLTSYISV